MMRGLDVGGRGERRAEGPRKGGMEGEKRFQRGVKLEEREGESEEGLRRKWR